MVNNQLTQRNDRDCGHSADVLKLFQVWNQCDQQGKNKRKEEVLVFLVAQIGGHARAEQMLQKFT